jgi:hypothetical protein
MKLKHAETLHSKDPRVPYYVIRRQIKMYLITIGLLLTSGLKCDAARSECAII